jgi:isopentenyl-diphosphate delta-isomerase
MAELVVLVDEQNRQIGTAEKNAVHTDSTPLHRGFSVFLLNSKKQILLTKRAMNKKTFPGVWSNTVCGHPTPGEESNDAAKRRLKEELGLVVFEVDEVAPYRYRFSDANGIVENEICPVFVARSDAYPRPNPREVESWKWVLWSAFLQEVRAFPSKYSPWSGEEAELVDKYLKEQRIKLLGHP